jgi:putative ABC transport system ATP-binding protein
VANVSTPNPTGNGTPANGAATNGAPTNGAATQGTTGNGTTGGGQSSTMLSIETEDLWRVYRNGDIEIPALRGLNLRIGQGAYIALKGRSGSGKTTLLNCLGGLDKPTQGIIRVFGESIEKWNEGKLTTWRRHHVGFIFQSLGLLPALSAYENVELMLRMIGVKGQERHKRTLERLEQFGLTRWMDHRPYELSGGQQQRVAIARSLANNPQIILADEPTGELDTKTGREVLLLFKNIVREENVSMLMATHDNLVDEHVDEVLHLRDGNIVTKEEFHAEIEPDAEEEEAKAQA